MLITQSVSGLLLPSAVCVFTVPSEDIFCDQKHLFEYNIHCIFCLFLVLLIDIRFTVLVMKNIFQLNQCQCSY